MATIARIVLGGNSQIEKRDILLKKVVSQLKVVMPGVLYFDVWGWARLFQSFGQLRFSIIYLVNIFGWNVTTEGRREMVLKYVKQDRKAEDHNRKSKKGKAEENWWLVLNNHKKQIT